MPPEKFIWECDNEFIKLECDKDSCKACVFKIENDQIKFTDFLEIKKINILSNLNKAGFRPTDYSLVLS